MKFDNVEVAAVQEVAENNENGLVELNDLQLLLIGGGGGEVVFH